MKRGLGCLLVVLLVATCASAQESVADAARKLKREKESAPSATKKAKRVFTDDDVTSVPTVVLPLPSPKVADIGQWARQREREAEEAEVKLKKLERMSEKQLGDDAVGSTVFAGRDVWERRLATERDRVVAASEELIAANREFTRAVSSGDQIRITGESKILADKATAYRVAKFRYDQLVEEGQKAAAKWKEGRDR